MYIFFPSFFFFLCFLSFVLHTTELIYHRNKLLPLFPFLFLFNSLSPYLSLFSALSRSLIRKYPLFLVNPFSQVQANISVHSKNITTVHCLDYISPSHRKVYWLRMFLQASRKKKWISKLWGWEKKEIFIRNKEKIIKSNK